jgi:hypothetical protein
MPLKQIPVIMPEGVRIQLRQNKCSVHDSCSKNSITDLQQRRKYILVFSNKSLKTGIRHDIIKPNLVAFNM